MLRTASITAFTILAAASSGCGLTTDIDPATSFASERAEWSDTLTARAELVPQARALLVRGLMLTPSECYGLRGDLHTQANVITVTITGTLASTACGTSAPGAYTYTFSITGLDGGTFTARVVHAYDGGRPSDTILEEQIIIE